MTLQHRTLRTRDGLTLHAEEAGPEAARAIVFVHGIAQDRTAFRSVLQGPLASEFRCIALDVRGHGDSEKPDDVGAYDGAHLAHDLAALIEGLALERPLLAGWSYGGALIGDYLRHYGDAAVGGVFSIAGSFRIGRSAGEMFGPGMMDHVRGLIATDPAIYEASARAFAAGCSQGAHADFAARRVQAMLRVPAHVRRALLTRDESYLPELSRGAFPLAAIHGDADTVVLPALSAQIRAEAPRAELTRLEGVGHVAFVEAEAAFVDTLSRFARAA